MSIGPQTSPQRLGKYELRERLGRGGMAEVWKAYDTQLHRYVALKILHADLQTDPEFITRFEREARVIASLHHPNIVQIHDFQIAQPENSNSPIAYMVMDYVEGQTLADYIRNTSRQGKFPPVSDVMRLFTAIGKAVDYAHSKGMVHRDIKPANILLDKRLAGGNDMGEPILTDFGIVKLLGATSGTLSGMWLGTPLYIAPEQAQGAPGNERSDIYSLGVILYEICTGVQPFRGENVTAIMIQHINSLPTPPALINPHIPPALSMVIMRCLAKDPAARFISASSMVAALAESLNMPVPSDLSLPGYPTEAMNAPTYLTPIQPNLPLGMTPSSPSQQQFGMPSVSSPFLQASVPLTTPQFYAGSSGLPTLGNATPANVTPSLSGMPSFGAQWNASSAGANGNPATTPAPSTAAESRNTEAPRAAIMTPSQPQTAPTSPETQPPAQVKQKRTRRPWLIAALIALILLVLGGSLGTFLLLSHKSTPPVPATSQVVGSVRFLSSGRLYLNNNHGINDEVQINLQNIPNPPTGKAYYAWLLGDANQEFTAPLMLGTGPLPMKDGSVDYLYQGDAQQTNLLTNYSRFLITTEDAQNAPTTPSFDYSAWRFEASIPTTPDAIPNTKYHFSMLDHLRHLLSDEQTIVALGLRGGLSIWLVRNTEEIFKWAVGSEDRWASQGVASIRQNLLNILYYLDGTACIAPDLQKIPAGSVSTPENGTIGSIARQALISTCGRSFDLVTHVSAHMSGVAAAPGATKATQDAANTIAHALSNVKGWLGQLRQDAVKLVDMTDTQLTQLPALSLLGDLATQARYAYSGRIDPLSGQYQGGVSWVYSSIQRLAVFNVTVCKSANTACV